MKIGIIGSAGRMGQALARAIAEAGHVLAGGIDKGGDVAALAAASHALVDFSAPAALEANLAAAQGAGDFLVLFKGAFRRSGRLEKCNQHGRAAHQLLQLATGLPSNQPR